MLALFSFNIYVMFIKKIDVLQN